MARLLVLGSFTVNRKIDPSGDQRSSLEVPDVATSRRGSLPSLFARNISLPLQNASLFPSGDHAPA